MFKFYKVELIEQRKEIKILKMVVNVPLKFYLINLWAIIDYPDTSVELVSQSKKLFCYRLDSKSKACKFQSYKSLFKFHNVELTE